MPSNQKKDYNCDIARYLFSVSSSMEWQAPFAKSFISDNSPSNCCRPTIDRESSLQFGCRDVLVPIVSQGSRADERRVRRPLAPRGRFLLRKNGRCVWALRRRLFTSLMPEMSCFISGAFLCWWFLYSIAVVICGWTWQGVFPHPHVCNSTCARFG